MGKIEQRGVLVLPSPLKGEAGGAEDGSGGWGVSAHAVQKCAGTDEKRLRWRAPPSPPTRREPKAARGDLPLKEGGQSKNRAALALLFIAIGFAGCAEPQPPEFLSPEHKFRVRFGSPPKVFDQPDGHIPTQLFTVSAPDGAYTVRAYKLPIVADAAAQESSQLLDEAKNDLLRSVGGTQTTGESVTLAGKYPGRAFTATVAEPKPGWLRGRIYLAGARLYKVTVFGTADFVNAPAATAFLDSFMVVE